MKTDKASFDFVGCSVLRNCLSPGEAAITIPARRKLKIIPVNFTQGFGALLNLRAQRWCCPTSLLLAFPWLTGNGDLEPFTAIFFVAAYYPFSFLKRH
jgi:hypothetical protein